SERRCRSAIRVRASCSHPRAESEVVIMILARMLAVAAGSATLAVAPSSFAQQELTQEDAERPQRHEPSRVANAGLQVGARLGYTAGAGSVISGLGVVDAASGAIPVILDA